MNNYNDSDDEAFYELVALGAVGICGLVAASEMLLSNKGSISRKRKRSCWVQPWRETRNPEGNIQALLKEYQLYRDSKAYNSFLAMDEACFNEILSYVGEDIKAQDTHLRRSIPCPEKLAATIRFLATGECFKELSENTKLSASFLNGAVPTICSAIYSKMAPIFLKFPDSKEKWMEIAKDFENRWQFPLCLGALDGKHVEFTPSKERSNLFYNYKEYHSLVLLAMANAQAEFTYVNVGCNGRISDGGVLSRSGLMKVLHRPENYFPSPLRIGNNRTLPFVIVADNAFSNMPNLLTPYKNSANLAPEKVNFNSRLSRARQNIERAFGIMSNKFRVLQTKMKVSEEKATTIVQACCVLHNFLIQRSSWYRENCDPPSAVADNEGSSECRVPRNPNTSQIKLQYTEYFANEGYVNLKTIQKAKK